MGAGEEAASSCQGTFLFPAPVPLGDPFPKSQPSKHWGACQRVLGCAGEAKVDRRVLPRGDQDPAAAALTPPPLHPATPRV